MSTNPPPSDASAFHRADLALLLDELHRVRDAKDSEAASAGEAITIAAAAVRIVETTMGRAGDTGLEAADLATVRAILQDVLETLNAVNARIEDNSVPSIHPRHRSRPPQRRKPH
ncbi:MAG TPA: hypothetical protein VE441_01375 [Mycobacterium sp.]|jgi:hypothetical protein|nr:hypothetical protein [Mycobacterium sp.]